MRPVDVTRPRVSYADLQHGYDDGRRYELYDGEACVVPSPLPIHQRAAREILVLLCTYASIHGGEALGSPIDVVFSEFEVVQPDVIFFEHARQHLVRATEPIRNAPDLAIEVLSPSTVDTDRGKKMDLLARYGVREYWLVDPVERSVEVYSLTTSGYALAQMTSGQDDVRSIILPDLAFPAARIFK